MFPLVVMIMHKNYANSLMPVHLSAKTAATDGDNSNNNNNNKICSSCCCCCWPKLAGIWWPLTGAIGHLRQDEASWTFVALLAAVANNNNNNKEEREWQGGKRGKEGGGRQWKNRRSGRKCFAFNLAKINMSTGTLVSKRDRDSDSDRRRHRM